MQFSDDLYQLIKSLTKAEKRYFKLQASLQKGEKDYLLLFDEVEAQVAKQRKEGLETGYDEAMLKRRLNQKISTSQLHVMKNYLMGLVLKSLRGLREKSNIEEQVSAQMSDLKILEQKGLYDIYWKRIETLKALCLKYELFHDMIEVLQLERGLCSKTSISIVEEKLEKIRLGIDRYMHLLNNTLLFQYLQYQIVALYRQDNRARSKAARQKLASLSNHPLLKDGAMPKTFQSKVSYYHGQAMISFMQTDLLKARRYYKQLLDVWAGYPHFKEEYPHLYIIHTSNYLVSCHLVRDYTPFASLLEEMKSMPSSSFYEEAEAFQNIYYLDQLYFMNQEMLSPIGANEKRAKSLALTIETGLSKYGDKVVRSRALSFMYNTAVMFFALGDYDEVIHWTAKILSFETSDQRKEVQLFARLLQLLIYTERGEHIHIDNAFKSFEYHLKKEDKQHEFEGKVTSYLKQLSARKQDRRTVFTQFKAALTQFEAQKIPGHEEISIWVEAKLQNRSFLDIMREKAAKQLNG